MKTIVIANQKGGSGKSTSTVHLAVAAEQAGDGPVLISDTDPQGSTGDWFNRRKRSGLATPRYCAYRKLHLWAEAVAHKACKSSVRTHASPRNNREAREIRTAIGEQEGILPSGQRGSAQRSLAIPEPTSLFRLRVARSRCVLGQREVRSGFVLIRQDFTCRYREASLKTITWSWHSRRIVPMTRSRSHAATGIAVPTELP